MEGNLTLNIPIIEFLGLKSFNFNSQLSEEADQSMTFYCFTACHYQDDLTDHHTEGGDPADEERWENVF